MKNKKTTIIITLSAVITSALGILFTFNKVIEKLATSKNLLANIIMKLITGDSVISHTG